MNPSRSEAFEAIYLTHSWGGRSRSGPGSDPEHSTKDITDGSSRPLRLDAPPFSLEAAEKSTYSVLLRKNPRRVIYEKDIVVWHNNQSPATSACIN